MALGEQHHYHRRPFVLRSLPHLAPRTCGVSIDQSPASAVWSMVMTAIGLILHANIYEILRGNLDCDGFRPWDPRGYAIAGRRFTKSKMYYSSSQDNSLHKDLRQSTATLPACGCGCVTPRITPAVNSLGRSVLKTSSSSCSTLGWWHAVS
jgi:hypothetical protein